MSLFAPVIAGLSVVAFLYPWREKITPRMSSLSDGKSGLKFVPVVACVVAPTLAATAHIAEYVPQLKWSLFSQGGNILASGFSAAGAGGATGPSGEESLNPALVELVIEIGGVMFLIVALSAFFIVINYEEEEWARESWGHVAGWAVSHLIMGVPLYAVPALFAAGAVYKYVSDQYGFEQAYAAHVGANVASVSLLGVITISVSLLA